MADDTNAQPRKKIVLDLDWLPEPVEAEHTVTFLPSGRRATVAHGWSVFEAGKQAGIYIPTTCGGKGTCGCCRVRVEGTARPPTYAERRFIAPADLAANVRLACRLRVEADIIVTVLQTTDNSRQSRQ